VRTAVRAFPGNEERRRRVLLFSDGENHSGDIQRAVEFAQSRDVQVHTIGVGTASGGPIPLPEGGFLEDAAGQRVVSRLEPSVLEQIADGTGGKYMAVENFDSVNEIVSALELQQQGDRIRFIQDGRYRIFLLLAIIFLFASIAVKVMPWKGTF
jgi:Ca-activated chloride channel family protein